MSETIINGNGIKVTTPEGIVDCAPPIVEVVAADEVIPAETMAEVEEPKPYTFRLLGAPDVFLMFKIIGKIGINEFTAVFGKEGILDVIKSLSEDEKATETGAYVAATAAALEVGHIILNNIGKCEDEIYKLLSQTSNLTVEEITAEGNAVMFMEMIIDFVQKEEFPDFIRVVSKLFK